MAIELKSKKRVHAADNETELEPPKKVQKLSRDKETYMLKMLHMCE